MVNEKYETQSHEFAENIINTVREPLISLDQDLRVVTANHSFYTFFKAKPEETVGQLIYDLGNKQWDIPKLRELLENILPQHTTFDNYEVGHDFVTIGRRIMLLNARQIERGSGKERIILLAIEDITERKEIEAGLEKTRKELETIKKTADEVSKFAENLINTVREPLIALDQDLRVVKVSNSFYDFFKVTPEETVGMLIYDLGNKQWDIPRLRELLETILPQKTIFNDYEVEHDFATIGRRVMLLNARQIIREMGKERIILLAIEDVTDRKRLENQLAESEERYRRLFETANDGILLLEKNEMKIRHANPAITSMLGYSKGECVGNEMNDIGILHGFGTCQEVLESLDKNGIIHYKDVPARTKTGQVVDTDIYMVDMANLIQCNIRDITENKKTEGKVRQNESTLIRLVDILQHRSETIQDFLDYALHQAIQLTESKIGYIYHYHEDRKEFVLNSWSKEVLPACTVRKPQTCYELEKTGLWGEAVRQRQSIIVNDFQSANTLKKGYPEGHVQLFKFMTIPIFKGEKIVSVVGLANKETDYPYNATYYKFFLNLTSLSAILC